MRGQAEPDVVHRGECGTTERCLLVRAFRVRHGYLPGRCGPPRPSLPRRALLPARPPTAAPARSRSTTPL